MPGDALPLPTGKTTHSAKNRRIRVVVTFVRNLNERLSKETGGDVATDALIQEIREHISGPRYYPARANIPASGGEEIEEQGTQLWNCCVRLRRGLKEEPASTRLSKFTLVSRTLAFHLLATRWSEHMQLSGTVRFMKLALKTARICVDGSELQLATDVLARAVEFNSHLQSLVPNLGENDVGECKRLEIEYLVLRIAQSWKDNRLDVAEHMYGQAAALQSSLDADYAEKFANVLSYDFSIAIKWLDRANEIVNAQGLEHLSREGVALRLAIQQALVTALLELNSAADRERARKIVYYIESELDDRLVVSLLNLELLQKMPAEEFDAEAYSGIVRHLVKTFDYSDTGFKLIVHHIRKLHEKNPGLACGVLDDFVLVLCRHSGRDDWLESLVLTHIWMATSNRESFETIDAIRGVLSKLDKPLGADTAMAALMLMVKNLETCYGQGQFDMAEKWCRLSLHRVFQNSGPANIAKLERKLLLCAISRNDMNAAVTAIDSMSPTTRGEPMSGYLMFQVAVRTHNSQLAAESLELVSSGPERTEYLSSCVADCYQAQDIFLAAMALKKLISKYEFRTPNPVHIAALLRCTIRLLVQMLDKQDGSAENKKRIIQDLVETFGAAVDAIRRDPRYVDGNRLFDVDELVWFSRNAYNLGMKNADSWDLVHIVGMLRVCVQILDQFPQDLGRDISADLSLKALFSHFVIAASLVSLARTQDHAETRLQSYVLMRAHVAAFDAQVLAQTGILDRVMHEDMLRKLATLLAFDFEAAISLKRWDDLGEIVQKAATCKQLTAFYAMGDCLLRSHAPAEASYSTMRQIINEIYSLEQFDSAKLAKYVRCLFQSTSPLSDDRALQVMEEACGMAREASESAVLWPSVELDWLATTAWNHGISCYTAQQEERAKQWLTAAMTLAHYQDDSGALEHSMHDIFVDLNLGVAEQ